MKENGKVSVNKIDAELIEKYKANSLLSYTVADLKSIMS